MDYQLLPCQCKPQVCEKKKRNHKRENSKKIQVSYNDNKVYNLQPMFKPPKSTKDTANTGDEGLNAAVKAISDSNQEKQHNQFNHFTQSRKGSFKQNGPSRVEDPFPVLSPTHLGENRAIQEKLCLPNEDIYAHSSRASFIDSSGRLSRERSRRASAGDELIKDNVLHRSHARQQLPSSSNAANDCPRVVSIGQDEVLLIPQQKQQTIGMNAKLRENSGRSVMSFDNKLQPAPEQCMPRRKSFHDWTSIQQWYTPDTRPSSTDNNSRKNVISPATLSRLLPGSEEQGQRQASASISVCTEADRMSYNFNLPNRRLVSHKDLKNYSLPYNDNIGLEETVTSDQARKAAKYKQTLAAKTKLDTNKQTPKQVWYRTVRSILAANHLYNSVKRKK